MGTRRRVTNLSRHEKKSHQCESYFSFHGMALLCGWRTKMAGDLHVNVPFPK